LGRRKRRTIRVAYRRRRPTFFRCPRCYHTAAWVEINRREGVAVVSCYNCGLRVEVPYEEGESREDVFAKFYDSYFGEG